MATKTKVTVKNHRESASLEEIDQIIFGVLRTFDYEHSVEASKSVPLNKKVSRVEASKAFIDLLETLGEDVTKYYDIFPIEWDIRFN